MIKLLNPLETTVNQLINEFDKIEGFRKGPIEIMARLFARYYHLEHALNLLFLCPNNSHRSHISQIWAQTAAHFYGFKMIRCYSGGIEETVFPETALQAILKAGFRVDQMTDGSNPIYEVTYSQDTFPLRVYSKLYNDPSNPQADFMTIINCARANESCPEIGQVEHRFSLIYHDPKRYNKHPQGGKKHQEVCLEIGRELLYLFHCCQAFVKEQPAYIS